MRECDGGFDVMAGWFAGTDFEFSFHNYPSNERG
jgi:hypothetical protein